MFFASETSTYLTDSTASFVRAYLRFCDDLLRMCVDAHLPVIQSAFVELFQAQFRHLESCWKNERYIDSVSELCQSRYFKYNKLVFILILLCSFRSKTSSRTCVLWCSRCCHSQRISFSISSVSTCRGLQTSNGRGNRCDEHMSTRAKLTMSDTYRKLETE